MFSCSASSIWGVCANCSTRLGFQSVVFFVVIPWNILFLVSLTAFDYFHKRPKELPGLKLTLKSVEEVQRKISSEKEMWKRKKEESKQAYEVISFW